MSIALTVKLQKDVYEAAERYFGKGKLNRNAYINEAVRFFTRAQARRRLARQMQKDSLAARRSSMEVLAELEAVDDEKAA